MDTESNARVSGAVTDAKTAVTDLLPECDFQAKALELLTEVEDIVATVIDNTPVGTAPADAVEELDKLAKGTKKAASKPESSTAKK